MRILGLSPDVWISSAALIEDGKVISAAPQERFDRQKMSQAFPLRAIDFYLREAKISMDDIDYVAMSWNPGVHLQSASLRYSKSIRWRGEYLYSVPSYLLTRFPFIDIEFKAVVKSVREVEKSLGKVSYELTEKVEKNREFSRSLFVVKDMKAGEVFTEENVRSIRPGYGLPPKYLKDILGKRATQDIKKGASLK